MKNYPTILEIVLAQAPNLPVSKRIFLYRELTELCGLPDKAAEFRQLATDLEAAESKHQDLALGWYVPTPGPAENGKAAK
jgi:hypothetical protein